jgi:anti-sigma regulatory factor (Ser/Thr protein kinase)
VDLPGAYPAVASSLWAIRGAVHDYGRAAGAGPELIAASVRAVNEAATNAIVHGYHGGSEDQVVEVGAEHDETWVRFAVGDHGPGLRPSRHSPGYGLGFAIIAQCSDDLEVLERPEGGIVVTMGFRLASAG